MFWQRSAGRMIGSGAVAFYLVGMCGPCLASCLALVEGSPACHGSGAAPEGSVIKSISSDCCAFVSCVARPASRVSPQPERTPALGAVPLLAVLTTSLPHHVGPVPATASPPTVLRI